MSDKQINGYLASKLMDATEHLTRLELAVAEMRWRICHRDDLRADGAEARRHCRKLIEALNSIDYSLGLEAEERKANVVEITPKAAVK